jgi:hypothetical protein
MQRYFGVYRAVVFANKDPLNQRRLKLIVPVVLGKEPTNWAWPVEPSGVELQPPSVGQGVWVAFENGDPSFPIWMGTFGKELSKEHKLLLNRLKGQDITPAITDLLEVVPRADGTKDLDVTETLLNIVRNRYYGSFLHTGTQTAVLANTPYAMPLNVTESSYGVSIVGGNAIRIQNTGIYNLSFSAQFSASNSSEHTVNIWLRHEGADVPFSNSKILFKANTIAAWNFFLDSDTSPQTWQLMWSTSSANVVSVSTIPASNHHPATPALILTVNKVK